LGSHLCRNDHPVQVLAVSLPRFPGQCWLWRFRWDPGSGPYFVCGVSRCDRCGGERPSPVACRSRSF
jgi:hypothetical protein